LNLTGLPGTEKLNEKEKEVIKGRELEERKEGLTDPSVLVTIHYNVKPVSLHLSEKSGS
jgi:hypothetical protein